MMINNAFTKVYFLLEARQTELLLTLYSTSCSMGSHMLGKLL